MGLDMYIYSTPRNEYETIKKKVKDLENSIDAEDAKFKLADNKLLIEKLEVFIDKYKDILPEYGGSEPIIEYLVYLVDTFAYGGHTIEDMKWQMFNSCSRFVGEDALDPIPNQDKVSKDFFDISLDFMRPDTLQNKVSEYRQLSERQQKLLTEECYWRKFKELNDHMCTDRDADNCNLVELCKDDIEMMIKVCTDNYKDPQQLLNLLYSWDNDRIYYYAWW